MDSKTIFLLFAKENESSANKLMADLKNSPITISPNPSPETLEEALKLNPSTCIVLLISDNFLRSLESMNRLSMIIQDPSEQMLPVILDGQQLRAGESDIYDSYPTKIGTIHEVMQYRDFWYEEWIRLRKASNNAEGEALEILEKQKVVAKKMSTNIGTFLRNINGLTPVSWDEFSEEEFQLIYQKTGINQEEADSPLAVHEQEAIEIPLTPKEEEAPADPLVEETAELETTEDQTLKEEAEAIEEMVDSEVEDVATDTEEDNQEEEGTEIEPVKEEAFYMSSLEESTIVDEEKIYEAQDIEELDDLDVLFFLADSEMEAGNFEIARDCYERVLGLDASNGRALLGLARLLDQHFEDESSMIADLYRKVLFSNDETAAIYYEYAHFLKKDFNSMHRASDLLHRAIELDPRFELAYLELADSQSKLGLMEQARANYLQALVLNSNYQSAELDAHYGVLRHVVEEEPTEELEEEPNLLAPNPNADKVVMVTGATAGIGQAIAQEFALNGYKVILTGRRAERLEAISEELSKNFEVNLQTLNFDVRNIESVKTALESLPEDWRNIDILINNAGLARGRAPIHEGNLEHWETMIDTNIKGLLYLTRLIAPSMVNRNTGFILNVGSVAGREAYSDGNVYCATKAAVDMLTRSMRLDLHQYGIRVGAVHPGHVETEFALVRFDGNAEKAAIYDNFSPLTAKDVAEVVYFMASRPERVNLQEVLMFGTQQASATTIDQSGRKYD